MALQFDEMVSAAECRRVMAMVTSERRRGGSRAECTERLRHGPVDRDDHVHQQVPAIRCRRDVLDEQIVQKTSLR